jgi:DNA topoisomerase II
VLWDLDRSLREEDEYTIVSFVPDLPKLTNKPSASKLTPDDYAMLCKRVVDIAGCAADALQVTLNGHDVSMSSFEDYVKLYRAAGGKSDGNVSLCSTAINPRWQVVVGTSQGGNALESISFVNSMFTPRGGTHVNAVVQQIVRRLSEHVIKMEPSLADFATMSTVKQSLFVAINALIENPSFDSQMKEYLTTSPQSFGSMYTLPDKFYTELLLPRDKGGPGIVEEIVETARGRQQASLFRVLKGSKYNKNQLSSIPKLEDAHKAGTKSGNQCTLILTEGDSAKALAVAGLEVVGREKFGVFPLRGKFLNVRVASISQLENNAEVKALLAILGLDKDKTYETVEERQSLRYGRVLLMADQDTGA